MGQILASVICLFLMSSTQVDARKISRVILDPGHGGNDSGAHRYSTYEKKLTLKVALKTEKLLKAKGPTPYLQAFYNLVVRSIAV